MPCYFRSKVSVIYSFQTNPVIYSTYRFDRLDLEGSSRCYYDHVSAFEGATTNRSEEIGRYCGNQTEQPPMLKSVGNVMTVQFKTDSSVTRTGYETEICKLRINI